MPEIQSRDTNRYLYTNIHSSIITVVKCPSTNKWISNIWHICAIELSFKNKLNSYVYVKKKKKHSCHSWCGLLPCTLPPFLFQQSGSNHLEDNVSHQRALQVEASTSSRKLSIALPWHLGPPCPASQLSDPHVTGASGGLGQFFVGFPGSYQGLPLAVV